MKTAILIVKTVISLSISVPAIILIFRDWKHHDKRTKLYKRITKLVIAILAIAALLSACMLWVGPWVQRQIARQELDGARPHVTIEFTERSDRQVAFEIHCPTTNTAPIQDLFLKFDIPGVFVEGIVTDKDKAESCDIMNSFLAGVGGDTIAETVHVHCKSLFPQGFLRGVVTFDRTSVRPVPGSIERGYTNMLFMPVMDLHDKSRCLFSWSHEGTPQIDQMYISFTNLQYIRQDNENLLSTFRQDELTNRYDAVTAARMRAVSTNMWTREWHLEIEERRKNW